MGTEVGTEWSAELVYIWIGHLTNKSNTGNTSISQQDAFESAK